MTWPMSFGDRADGKRVSALAKEALS
jgi:hypothetical protein